MIISVQPYFHLRLTVEQTDTLERIQKVCLKIILSEIYFDYDKVLEMCGLQRLGSRREKRCLNFSLKCLKHPRNYELRKYMFYCIRVGTKFRLSYNFWAQCPDHCWVGICFHWIQEKMVILVCLVKDSSWIVLRRKPITSQLLYFVKDC